MFLFAVVCEACVLVSGLITMAVYAHAGRLQEFWQLNEVDPKIYYVHIVCISIIVIHMIKHRRDGKDEDADRQS